MNEDGRYLRAERAFRRREVDKQSQRSELATKLFCFQKLPEYPAAPSANGGSDEKERKKEVEGTKEGSYGCPSEMEISK